MSVQIERESTTSAVVGVTDSTATSGSVMMQRLAGGLVFCSAASASPVTLQWWARFEDSTTWFRLYDKDNAAINTTVQANRCYPVPDELFGAVAIMAVANTAGQTATLRIALKG